MLSRTLTCSVLLSLASAAQTFVVDAENRPGTDFTSLVAAIAAVPSGSTLLVRGGRYFESPEIQGKALAIVCEPAATVLLPLGGAAVIRGLAAQQNVTIRDLILIANSNNPSFSARLSAIDADGLVLLDGVRGAGAAGVTLVARNCARLSARRCEFRGSRSASVEVEGGNACFESCWLGRAEGANGQVGLRQSGGTVQLVDCQVDGSQPLLGISGPAVDTNGSLRVLGNSVLRGGAFPPAALAIAGTGTVRLEPSVQLFGASPLLDPRLQVTTRAMPRMTAAAQAGGQVDVALHGPHGDAAAIFVGLPGVPVPLFGDAVWLGADPLVLRLGGVAPLSFRTAPLHNLAPPGFCLGWQAVTLTPTGTAQLSNPVFHVAW